MSFFLPIFSSQPHVSNSAVGVEATQEPLGNLVQRTSQEPGPVVATNLEGTPKSPVEASAFLQHLRLIESGETPLKEEFQDLFVGHGSSGSNLPAVNQSPTVVAKTFSQTVVPQKVDLETLAESAVPVHSIGAGKAQVSEVEAARAVRSHDLLSTALPTTNSVYASIPVTTVHVLENSAVQVRQLPGLGAHHVRQILVDETRALENLQSASLKPGDTVLAPQTTAIAKTLGAGGGSVQGTEGQVIRQATLPLTEKGEVPSRAEVQGDKEILKNLDQIQKPIFQNASSNGVLQKSQVPPPKQLSIGLISQNIPVTAVNSDGPSGFTEQGVVISTTTKPLTSNHVGSSELSAGQLADARSANHTDLLAEPGLFGKGERVHSITEALTKGVGVDSSGGQSGGMGMNNFSQSQSSFQQSTASQSAGIEMRRLDERAAAFPGPALQRLQMDVQLSENQRVQIDVGVQNRQVYAGLVMDHSVLRNLAAQFVPQLESQLAQADLDLQEFSAEMREDDQQYPESWLDQSSQNHYRREGGGSSENAADSSKSMAHRQVEPGVHFVA